jgi:hypothetical protein
MIRYLLLLTVVVAATATPVRIVFAHKDAQHIEWNVKRHLDTAFHHAGLQVKMDMWQKPSPRLVLTFPLDKQQDVWCALRTSDVQANYWTSHLQWNDPTETFVLHGKPESRLLGYKLDARGEYKGQSWREVLDVAMREVSAWECTSGPE